MQLCKKHPEYRSMKIILGTIFLQSAFIINTFCIITLKCILNPRLAIEAVGKVAKTWLTTGPVENDLSRLIQFSLCSINL